MEKWLRYGSSKGGDGFKFWHLVLGGVRVSDFLIKPLLQHYFE